MTLKNAEVNRISSGRFVSQTDALPQRICAIAWGIWLAIVHIPQVVNDKSSGIRPTCYEKEE